MPADTVVYDYPDAAELKEIEPTLLPIAEEEDPIFKHFPIEESPYDRLIWVQRDNYFGLQQIRGLEGEPKVVRRPGSKTYDFEPGVYGEFTEIGSKELQQRRKLATWNEPIDISDLVGESQMFLLRRRIDRVRYILWTLLTSGIFSVADANGSILQTDKYPVQTITAGIPWSTFATAVPFQNIQAAQLLALGQSVDFGAGAELWMNRVTANWLLNNANPNDLFGRRIGGGSTVNTVGEVSSWLESNDLPQIVVYDRFYIDDNGAPQRFIPNGKVVLIGRRANGDRLGEYRMTRNPDNPNMEPGAHTVVIDSAGIELPPRKIQVYDGHNGGPVIYYPGAVVVLTVGS